MSSPTLKVEIAFTSEPLDTTPTWVDVSQYVRRTPGVTIRRGRQSELDQFDAGYLQLTLSNRDRRFDPSYAAGPHFGNLIPRKQIRVTAVWAAVDYVQFTGWVTGWPQGFGEYGKDAMVTIEAFSAEAWLMNTALPNDTVYDYAATTIGSLVLFLRGADITQWNDASSNGYYATPFIGTARFTPASLGSFGGWSYGLDASSGLTSASLAPGMSSTAVIFDGSTIWVSHGEYSTAGPWSLSFWIQTTDANFPDNGVMGGGSGATATFVDAGGSALRIAVETLTIPMTDVRIDDGSAHHVVFTQDGSTLAGSHVYVDGVDKTGVVTWGGSTGTFYFNFVGARTLTAGTTQLFAGSLQDIAVFSKVLSAAEVAAFYGHSFGHLAESSATRVTRLLDDCGWPAAWREITTTSRATVGELIYNGSPVLGKLQEVQRTEQGRIFATKAGNVAFRERYYVQEVTVANTVQQIFSDDNGATALPFSTFQFQYNDIDVTNSATVTTPTTHAAASDAASIAANGLQSKKVDTILTTFVAADAMALGLVAEGKDATYRVPPILVYPENNTTRWDEVLLLELGYRVAMEITPMAVGAQNVQEVTVEQMEWLIENTLWSFTVAGSPTGSPAGGGGGDVFFVIGTSLITGPDVIGY